MGKHLHGVNMFLLIVCVLAVVVYGTYRIAAVHKGLVVMAGFLENELKEIRSLVRETEHTTLAYDWFDEGWPVARVDEEDRAPIENPAPAQESRRIHLAHVDL